MTALLVLLGAMVGAPARYLVDRTVQARTNSLLPLGTMTVNVVGSAILGGLAGASANHWVAAVLGTGFCGALTTFSTFGYETVRLVEDAAYLAASANVCISVALGLGAAFAGSAAAEWVLT